MPRPLSERERAILDLLLSADFPGVEALRIQARALAAGRPGVLVDLLPPEGSPTAQVVNRTPVQAVVDGDGFDGGLILFVDDGRLSALEYWWVTEDPPAELPPLSAIGQPVVSVA